MTKKKRLIALCLALLTIFGLTACSSSPDLSADECISKGYALLNPEGDTPREFTFTITQGANYEFEFTGRMQNGKMLISLLVNHNNMPNNYKELYLIDGNTLSVNLNGAMSAAETELAFVFNKTSEMQGKYVSLTDGYSEFNNFTKILNETYTPDIHTIRNEQENGAGEFGYNFTYSNEKSQAIMDSLSKKTEEKRDEQQTKVNDMVKKLTGDSYSTFDTILAYINDCVDIDTNEVTAEHPSLGEHVTFLMAQEMTALKNLMSIEGSYISEGISYTEDDFTNFKHRIQFCDKDGNVYGGFDLEVKTVESIDEINPDAYSYIGRADCINYLLENVKLHKGVGYETHDFPYTATYTNSTLTLEEKNDVYKATHVFEFTNNRLSKYTITYATYDLNIHNALAQHLASKEYTSANNQTDALKQGIGAGILEYYTENPGSQYNNAPDTIELLKIITEIGMPLYERKLQD